MRLHGSMIGMSLGTLVAIIGCGRVGFDDAPSDACLLGPFGSVQNLGPALNSTGHDYDPALSADQLTVYFTSDRSGGTGGFDLYVATRAMTTEAFGSVSELAILDTPSDDWWPALSADELTLYFASARNGPQQLFRSSRASTTASWNAPTLVVELAGEDMYGPELSSDGSELFYNHRTPKTELVHAHVSGGIFVVDGLVTELNDIYDGWPSLSADGLTIYFESSRTDPLPDIYMATRPSIGATFSAPVPVAAAALAGVREGDPEISPDGLTLMFEADRPDALGFDDLYAATRQCE